MLSSGAWLVRDTISDCLEKNGPTQELTVLGTTCFSEDEGQAACYSVETGLWDMLWPQSKVCSRGTLLVAEEGLREGEMPQFFPELNL